MRNLSRRRFLQASGGLLLAVGLPAARGQQEDSLFLHRGFTPNAFVRVASDNTVTVIVKHLEMGQGTYTGLPTLVAEELDADWSQVRVEGAPADASRYNNLFWGPAQGTGGSTALANSWEQLRKAGATARAMLAAAAAERWNAPVAQIRISRGVISWKDKKATFGQLAAAAAVHSEGAVHSHTRRAQKAGATPDEINHAILLLTSTIGFPTVVAALSWADDIIDKPQRRKPLAV